MNSRFKPTPRSENAALMFQNPQIHLFAAVCPPPFRLGAAGELEPPENTSLSPKITWRAPGAGTPTVPPGIWRPRRSRHMARAEEPLPPDFRFVFREKTRVNTGSRCLKTDSSFSLNKPAGSGGSRGARGLRGGNFAAGIVAPPGSRMARGRCRWQRGRECPQTLWKCHPALPEDPGKERAATRP